MTPNSRSYLNRWAQPDSIIPDPSNPLDFDRYSYVRNNPINYVDPTGHFSEEKIKKYLGFKEDDLWEKVLELFEKGGKYAGRWGWLEVLRKAEIGDQITIEWADGIFPEEHSTPGTLTFDEDAGGNLILTGDGFYTGHEIAGLFGENYTLSHHVDSSAGFCSPYECGYETEFNTSAEHDPYYHYNVKWEEATNPVVVVDVAKMAGATVFVGSLTVAGVGIVMESCLTLVGCVAGVAAIGPVTGMGAIATYYLYQGTVEVFKHEFLEITP